MPTRVAFLTIWVALGLLGVKFLAWWLTGSVAILSDALESVVNVVAAVIAYGAIKLAAKPADSRHSFGHGKAEYLSAVIEGTMIFVAAFLIIREAIGALSHPVLTDTPTLGLAVNILAAALNLGWALYLKRVAAAHRSPAMEASARHIITDVMTSVGVVAGLVLAYATGWLILDPILAILVALNIMREGWHVISESVDGLMDAELDDEELALVRAAVDEASAGALQYHDLRTRRAGRQAFVELHLVVDREMTVGASHVICDRIEDAVSEALPGTFVTVHVEPDDKFE